jgi:hypothetical protein
MQNHFPLAGLDISRCDAFQIEARLPVMPYAQQ